MTMNYSSIERKDTSWIYESYAISTRDSFTFSMIDQIFSTIKKSLRQDLIRNSHFYFSKEQYLFDDNVYINSRSLMTSYKVSHIRDASVRKFNRRLSRIRINIVHIFEILKERWKSLIELKLRIRWITACVVLHTVLLNMNDEWNKEEEW